MIIKFDFSFKFCSNFEFDFFLCVCVTRVKADGVLSFAEFRLKSLYSCSRKCEGHLE